MSHPLLTLLAQHPRLVNWKQLAGEGRSLLAEGLWNAPKALLIALAQQANPSRSVLILTSGAQDESRLYHDLPLFTDLPVLDFPAWETLPGEKIPPSPDIVGERYEVLRQLASGNPHIVLGSLHACLQRLIPKERFCELDMQLEVGQTIRFDMLLERLDAMGYTRCPVAADKGEYAVRGGIVDLFPVDSPDPHRIEFFGDEIESIRVFDPVSQRSLRPESICRATPAVEMELLASEVANEQSLATIFDYLGEDVLVVFEDLLPLEDRYAALAGSAGKPSRSFMSLSELLDCTEERQKMLFSTQPLHDLCSVHVEQRGSGNYYSQSAQAVGIQFELFGRSLSTMRWVPPFASIGETLLLEEGAQAEQITEALYRTVDDNAIHLLTESEGQREAVHRRLGTLFERCHLHTGYLSEGFALPDQGIIILPHTEFTGRHKIRRQKLRSTYHSTPIDDFDLSTGDSVVHTQHGIGKFVGLQTRDNAAGEAAEFFQIEYADKASLFVPINQAHLITKYVGAQEETPTLHKIGGKRWQRAKETTERAIMGYASELLELYAQRQLRKGHTYGDDSDDIRTFEDEFPFVETEDQVLAIADVKGDMRTEQPMDRLICGDVGYGKTEVAMRAAFKAVVDGGKQVAVLVPTAVLALQHYENFVDRMANFPIRIALLSKFKTAKERRETLKGVEEGTVDIVVGTHRLISKDVTFKNLGLVIVDEEQRFGVKAKEYLKKLRSDVDSLTLSATPIPRTLYMSMLGVRPMSVIATPPQDRLPIKTIVTVPDDETIKNALLRELTRDGQAFVVHNRVDTIELYASKIQKLLPQARITIAHGQMDADMVDAAFHAFKSGRVDILIATSIVENGIDIPNANTIIVDRADRFGLADLYQLRGRVGRWNRRAYAYFLVPRNRAADPMVQKRMSAIASASGYGGGMKLAMRDLEIRGAGDILGTEQSGYVSAVGFHLYCKLLKRKVEALQGGVAHTIVDTRVDFPYDARLPGDYVDEAMLRMEIYQRFGESVSLEEVDAVWRDLKDRFGPPPTPAKWLYHLNRLRVWASRNSIVQLSITRSSMEAIRKQGKQETKLGCPLPKLEEPAEVEQIILPLLKRLCKS